MFFGLAFVVLACTWPSMQGALHCPTTDGKRCVFPFKSSGGSTMYNECADYRGKNWCATEVDAKSKTYKTFGWCEKDKCKEVDEAAEMVKKIQAGGECYQCLEDASMGPPANPWPLKCLQSCVLKNPGSMGRPVAKPLAKPSMSGKAKNQECFGCLLASATRQCLAPCGLPELPLKQSAQPDCVQKGLGFSTESQAVLAVFTGVSSARGCGQVCQDSFPKFQGFTFANSKAPVDERFRCFCLSKLEKEVKNSQWDSGKADCPPRVQPALPAA